MPAVKNYASKCEASIGYFSLSLLCSENKCHVMPYWGDQRRKNLIGQDPNSHHLHSNKIIWIQYTCKVWFPVIFGELSWNRSCTCFIVVKFDANNEMNCVSTRMTFFGYLFNCDIFEACLRVSTAEVETCTSKLVFNQILCSAIFKLFNKLIKICMSTTFFISLCHAQVDLWWFHKPQ